MRDSSCRPYYDEETGQWLYGGAARNKRIKNAGGLDKRDEDIVRTAIKVYREKEEMEERKKTLFRVV